MVHGDRSVDVFVRKLRSKLERVSPSWRYIHTHFGIGYRFAAEPVEEPAGSPLPVPGQPIAAVAGEPGVAVPGEPGVAVPGEPIAAVPEAVAPLESEYVPAH
jgi:hypothetical protein